MTIDTIVLDLTGIAHGGEAIGRHEGKIIFVAGAIPGERVRVELVEGKDRWARARLIEVLTPSPDRVMPPCPFFGIGPGYCGGCQWQHIAYPRQLELKREIVRDHLARLARLPDVPVHPARAVGEPYGYRNHVQLVPAGDGYLGYLEHASHRAVAIDNCLLMHPLLDELFVALDLELPELKQVHLRAGVRTGEQMIVFETEDDEPPEIEVDMPVSCVFLSQEGAALTLMGYGHIVERVAGREFQVSAGSFFQVNTAGAEAMVEIVRSCLAPQPTDVLLDAYCGVGLFSLSLAGEVARVIGIEAHPAAAADFRANAVGSDQVAFIEATVEEGLGRVQGPIHLAVADPPRRGMGREAIAGLARLAPRRLAYVSCDPATLARDAALLTEMGFRLVEVQPVDLFPQTYHVESVALFMRL
ncbi:MAG: 23S rRNA (uracil(1939)-C(5))-methyltransferase RlmD [Anaerolineae bacterium]|nr:23S rRNA (uracil(1939)-C(5))-methyltransferase RlmD [Anaerolineae bacterium]